MAMTLEKPAYLDLDPLFYSLHDAAPLASPRLISLNPQGCALIGLSPHDHTPQEWIDLINGQAPTPPCYAMCYAGHQFGYYVPRLGDGRALNLGQKNGWHIQLKGAGQTLYSRDGDGRAVLRSSIREYLCAEAMAGLGIPTTRSLGLIGSKTRVMRDWASEEGAIAARLSLSWVRFGTFEYFSFDKEKLQALADHVIQTLYPHLEDHPQRYLELFREVMQRTAKLIAHWMSVGFCHGVMNTDNMSIAGLTLDYGPFAFMDHYDINYICNHTDREGRYSYGNQPRIARWNLSRLARALNPLISSDHCEAILNDFAPLYSDHYVRLMGEKLGLLSMTEDDTRLVGELFGVMQRSKIDYHTFFYRLSLYTIGDRTSTLNFLTKDQDDLFLWLNHYDERLKSQNETDAQRQQRMRTVNPKYILKNYILQEAIEAAAKNDNTLVEALLTLAHTPYDEHPDYERYALPTPTEYQNGQLSCSS